MLNSLQASAAAGFDTTTTGKNDEGAAEAKHAEGDAVMPDEWIAFTDDASGQTTAAVLQLLLAFGPPHALHAT